MKQPGCIFCNIEKEKILLSNEEGFVIYDKYPESKGHVLIIPEDHVEDYFDLKSEVKKSLAGLLDKAKVYCDENFNPKGYNVIINVGRNAGQVIMHTHIHLIPVY